MSNISKPIYRLIAGVIDKLVYNLPFVYLIYKLSRLQEIESILNQFWYIVIITLTIALITPIINSFLTSYFGGTIGKLLTGIKIVDSEGKNLGFWQAFARNYIAYLVSKMVFWLGFIWIFVDKENKGWHDMIADTYVLLVNKKMIIIGVIVAIVFLGLHIFLIKISIQNFSNNSVVYLDLLS